MSLFLERKNERIPTQKKKKLILMSCRVDKGLKQLAERLDEFAGKDERIPKLSIDLNF